jgi:hypothetical protein
VKARGDKAKIRGIDFLKNRSPKIAKNLNLNVFILV